MNKLKTTDLGGLRYRLNDLRWVQEANETAFKSILNAVDSNKTIILSGCVISGTTPTYSISEGYVSIEGEVIYVPAHSFPAPTTPDVSYLEVQTSWDPSGLKVFKSGVAHDTYEIRTALVVSGTLPSLRTNVFEMQSIIQSIGSLLSLTSWNALPSSFYEYPGPCGPPMFMRDSLGFVHFKGMWGNEDPGSLSIIGVLPVGFRPPETIVSFLPQYAADVNYRLEIETTGNIKIYPSCPQSFPLTSIVPFRSF